MGGGIRSDEEGYRRTQTDRRNDSMVAEKKGRYTKTVRHNTVHLSRCSAYRAKTSFLSFRQCSPPSFKPRVDYLRLVSASNPVEYTR